MGGPPAERAVLPLETGIEGIFAAGDVRCGSVKRVGAAIGEGAAVVAQLHTFLARRGQPASKSQVSGVSPEHSNLDGG